MVCIDDSAPPELCTSAGGDLSLFVSSPVRWGKYAGRSSCSEDRNGTPLHAQPCTALWLQVSRASFICSRNYRAVEKTAHIGNGSRTTEVNIYVSRKYIPSEVHILLGIFHYKMLIIGNLKNEKKNERNWFKFHHPEETVGNIFVLFSLRIFIWQFKKK